MQAKGRSTVVGVFEDRLQADRAVAELRAAGFRDDQIGLVTRDDRGKTSTESAEAPEGHAGSGLMAGALTGLGLGALAGLGVIAGVIPVVGPAIAAGTLGVIASNAAAGAGIAGLVGALIGYGVPEEEARYYEDEFKQGRTIVTVTADGRADEARAILDRNGAYDMHSESSRSVGTARASRAVSSAAAAEGVACTPTLQSSAAGRTTGSAVGAKSAAAGETIQVKEERLHAETKPVDVGEVRVRKEVHTETKTLNVPVEREEVVIERVPVSGQAACAPTDAIRAGEEIRIPVREDHVEVQKHAVVTEEVRVGKRTVQDTEQVTGQVRKEEVKVERKGDVDVTTKGKGSK